MRKICVGLGLIRRHGATGGGEPITGDLELEGDGSGDLELEGDSSGSLELEGNN